MGAHTGAPLHGLACGRTHVTDFESTANFRWDGSTVSAAEERALEASFGALTELAYELGEELDNDISIAQAVRRVSDVRLTAEQRWLLAVYVELNFAASIDDLSLWWADEGEAFSGNEVIA